MAIGSGLAEISDANLTILAGILSIPVAFLKFGDFRMVLISLDVTLEPQLEEGTEMELDSKFLFLWISTILGWFLYLSKIGLETPFLLSNSISNSTFSSLKPFSSANVMIVKKVH